MIDHKLGFLFGYKPLPNKIYTRPSKCDLLSEINSPWAGNKLIISSGLEEIYVHDTSAQESSRNWSEK